MVTITGIRKIWRSVEAWMRLRAGQTLYLECAEDYDRVDGKKAESVQVKMSSQNITLGSSDVRDAIENCWHLLERNQDRESITLRFITRGAIGTEKSRPFGKHKGLELWRRAAAGDDDAAKLVGDYLKSAFKTSELNDFIAAANPVELREGLLEHLVWATKEPGIEAVRIAVERLAIGFGNSRDIGSASSLSALNALLEHCRSTATRSEPDLRSLTIEDKIRIFEQHTDIKIPGTQQLLSQMLGAMLASGSHPSLGQGEAMGFAPAMLGLEPTLPDYVLPRSALVRKIAKLPKTALIVGSEGTGKTTIASLVGRDLGGVDCWVDLSSTDSPSLISMLERTLIELRGGTDSRVVVLDDLPVGNNMGQSAWVRLQAIVGECELRSHKLILTAKGVDPNAVDPRLRAAGIGIYQANDLPHQEISEFVALLGCPAQLCNRWASAILAESGGGHPKLVYLRGLELRDQAWAEPVPQVFLKPARSIEEARTFARKEAARTLPNEDRELLYAVSIAINPMDRASILSFGARFVGLVAPGDALDRLVGRWIESQGSDRYRATALLSGQAALAWPSEKLRRAHGCLFDVLVARHTMTVDQAFPLFLHAWNSSDDDRIAGYLAALANEQGPIRDSLYEYLAPLMLVGRLESVVPNTLTPRTIVLLRTVQFRIAMQQDSTQLAAFAEEWREALDALPEGPLRDGGRLIRSFLITGARSERFPPAIIVQALIELQTLEPLLAPGLLDESATDLIATSSDGKQDLVAAAFGFIYGQLSSLDLLIELLDALEQTAPAARARMLKAFDIPFFRKNHLFVAGPFVMEARSKSPRWDLAVQTLRRMIRLATQSNCRQWAILATRSLSIVHDGHLKQPNDALDCLRETADRFGRSPILDAQEANIYFEATDYKKAIAIWNESLWRLGSDIENAERDPSTLRKAGIAAGSNGDFTDASKWFESAAASWLDLNLPILAGGAFLDAAYCAFLDGSPERTVFLALSGLEHLRGEPDSRAQFEHFAASKLAFHVLHWVARQVRHEFDISPTDSQPLFGQCSNPTPDKRLGKDVPVDWDVSAAMLAGIASALGVVNDGIAGLRSHLAGSTVPAASFYYWALRCGEAFETGQLDGVCQCLLAVQRANWMHIAQERIGAESRQKFNGAIDDNDRSKSLRMEPVLVAALFVQLLANRSTKELADRWLLSLRGDPDGEAFRSQIELALQVVSVDEKEAHNTFFDAKSESLARLGAGCVIIATGAGDAKVAARAQTVVLLWLRQLASLIAFEGMLLPLSQGLARGWLDKLEPRSLLIAPNLSIPMLRAAIDSDENPPQKLIQLFDAVAVATGIRLEKSLREDLLNAAKAHQARAAS